ncbi:MAG: hypothetical protein BGO59_23515 [Spirosoma sp. 48-14]|nr:MAG: hypothetical protein BGO59_23515 [Spirosoma sp. 48-14]
MASRKFILSTLFIFLNTTFPNYAQLFFSPGYVVLTNGDTLRGELKEQGNKSIFFRKNTNSAPQPYDPTQISSYYSDNTNHVAVTITESQQETIYFMREVIKGYVSLYRLLYPEGRLTHTIRLSNGSFIPLRGTIALLMLTNNLTECRNSEFTRLLNPQLFYNSEIQLKRIVNAYNQCVQPNKVVIQPPLKKRFSYEAGLFLSGLQNNWLYGRADKPNTVYYDPYGLFSPLYTGTLGAMFTIFPRKRLSGSIEFITSYYKGNRNVPITDPLDPSNPNYRLYSFEEHYVCLPISARYVFIDQHIRWYAKAGLMPSLTTSVEGNYFDSGQQQTSPITILNKKNIGIGYLVGVGTDIPIKEQHVYVEFRMAPHFVLDGVTRTAISRSYQFIVYVPLIKHW